MNEETKKPGALARLDAWGKLKRQQLTDAIEAGKVGDPLSATIFGVTLGSYLLGAAVSVAASLGSSPLTRTLPRRGDK